MKRLFLAIAALALLAHPALAHDLDMPHDFVGGQLVGADPLNENFQVIQDVLNPLSLEYFGPPVTNPGTDWKCKKYIANSTAPALASYDMEEGHNATYIFSTDFFGLRIMGGDSDLYKWESINVGTPPVILSPFRNAANGEDICDDSGTMTTVGNFLVVSPTGCGGYDDGNMNVITMHVQRVSDSKFIAYKANNPSNNNTFSLLSSYNPVLICNKQYPKPAPPTNLTATVNAMSVNPTTVSLSWTASTGASSYTLYRKTTASGTFVSYKSDITAVTSSDTVPLFSTYWYRVTAVSTASNAKLESLGSNVVSATGQ